MVWMPPENVEEKIKRWLIPSNFYIRYLHGKEMRKGERELHLIRFLSQRDKISLDIGAYKGVYAYEMLRWSNEVHAFEPNPKSYRVLSNWAGGRVKTYSCALGGRTGRSMLKIPRSKRGFSNQGGTLSDAKIHDKEYIEFEIDCYALDDLCISNIGFIKIDIEGFELEVLKGAENTVSRERPNLLIEIEENHIKRDIREAIDKVCQYGYACFGLCNGNLRFFENIDIDKHHRNPSNKSDYIFNFVFLPLPVS